MESLRTLFTVLLLVSSISCVFGQKTVKGRIVGENLDELPSVRIYSNDTVLLGETAIDGYFEISIPQKTTNLSFSFIGYETAIASISDTCNYLEVVLLLRST
ncbi:carboxypeptidase-like regulatory domain-containing protein [Pontibacter harenae]|uniref:carboxypeptidase-like regulatory domain-containing protein n=1 Tax=Pontibacter harenae TaxID=2894083 RepID=UPI001E318265|nr:carboxypeptidase-like regulatory domain-containing protein [Pontibacter harenae]MCC9168939.1 carboxypeptidase-like regulatory domain-containing protein [Pontibacter harenae]